MYKPSMYSSVFFLVGVHATLVPALWMIVNIFINLRDSLES